MLHGAKTKVHVHLQTDFREEIAVDVFQIEQS
jgi:hypothetical protein